MLSIRLHRATRLPSKSSARPPQIGFPLFSDCLMSGRSGHWHTPAFFGAFRRSRGVPPLTSLACDPFRRLGPSYTPRLYCVPAPPSFSLFLGDGNSSRFFWEFVPLFPVDAGCPCCSMALCGVTLVRWAGSRTCMRMRLLPSACHGIGSSC